MEKDNNLKNSDGELKKLKRQLDDTKRERDKYRDELDYTQKMQTLISTPLLLVSISRVVDDVYAVIHTPSGNDFLVNLPPQDRIPKLSPGDVVGVNQQTLKIEKLLPPNYDAFIAGMEMDDKPKETYSDVGGLDDILQTIREVIELPLINPHIFEVIGIDPPKGVLLQGPPGTGKTLIARAVANATHASFIRLVGSELIQKYIGEGARMVRELFALARTKAPSILFIDEIDAVASKRTQDSQVSDREVQRTLMQLLAELDGFKSLDNVKIIAATNRPDILDPAILRPGRFDRIIEVGLPDLKGRHEIFKIHTRRMPLEKSIDLLIYATRWDELTGADIKSLCMEAGMQAIRANRTQVLESDFTSAYAIFKKVRKNEVVLHMFS
jgi:proteasome regulatory subunit